MATLASASLLAERDAAAILPRLKAAGKPLPERAANDPGIWERGVYRPSRKSGPVAFLASVGMIGAALAALATLNIVGKHQPASRLAVVEMKELDTTPPPPPEKLVKPVEVPPQAFVPKPMIQLPSPGPTQVALDLPPPPAPVVQAIAPAPEAPVPSAAPAAPAASSSPVEGGDLSSQVLSAKPPVYPIEARRAREQGTVKLMVLVGPDGRVSDIAVAGSSGSKRLDQAALSAVRRWRWTPQNKNGAPVAVRGYVTIPFVLTT
jgi:periplasmic protein TonB